MAKLLSIVTPCCNEEGNVIELYERVAKVMSFLSYEYEHIFIDNHSTDATVSLLKDLASKDPNVKLIVNARNFGFIRSQYHGLLSSSGAACILIASDLQDPPEIILDFIKSWEQGFRIVMATKRSSDELSFMYAVRNIYYLILTSISDVPLVKNATGAGMFDREVIEILRKIDDPYPFLRGLVCEIGFPIALIPFHQPRRMKGITNYSFYALYDTALLGITNHSKVPLRIMTISGFVISASSVVIGLSFFLIKLFAWDYFQMGVAALLSGVFLLLGLVLSVMGVLGEYIGAIYTYIRKIPHVVELERINFDR